MGWKTTLFRCGPPPPSETGTLPPHQPAFYFKESLDPISHDSGLASWSSMNRIGPRGRRTYPTEGKSANRERPQPHLVAVEGEEGWHRLTFAANLCPAMCPTHEGEV